MVFNVWDFVRGSTLRTNGGGTKTRRGYWETRFSSCWRLLQKAQTKREKLENHDVQAELGWKNEKEEYWSSKMCKKNMKMYHIDKLWPKEYHVAHINSFACKPWMCKDDHFIHREQQI
jgi:hypothetical protein